jgi:uncharacterized protein YlaI
MKLKTIRAWPIWEFECPDCLKISNIDNDKFDSRYEAEWICPNCKAKLKIKHD